jgi:RnfABCDGE-type electron transport complex G subunit
MKDWRDLLFMAVLTTVCTVLLVLSELAYQSFQAADPAVMRQVFGILTPAGKPLPADVRAAFADRFVSVKHLRLKGEFHADRLTPGVVVREAEGAGLWGKIRLLLAFDVQRQVLLGVAVLDQSETPGLGSRITEPAFLQQMNQLPVPKLTRSVKSKFREGEFDGITGATISSTAMADILNVGIGQIRTAAAAGLFPASAPAQGGK